jgi:hypothetical protein
MTKLEELKQKLKAREGKSAFRDNVPLLKAEIARLEAQKQLASSLE